MSKYSLFQERNNKKEGENKGKINRTTRYYNFCRL